MTQREKGFLLLTSQLGNPLRKPMTVAQFRVLANRVRNMEIPVSDRELTAEDITAMGYALPIAASIVELLAETELLEYYLKKGQACGCMPITRVSEGYPAAVRRKLGDDCPGVLWSKGDVDILRNPRVALVGSRDLREENHRFAREVGRQAAIQGYTLVSGNARGADVTAQEACLEMGGTVISVVADKLKNHPCRDRVLYLSEDGYDVPFSSPRAHSRNRIIHSLCPKTFVAPVTARKGGTWQGTTKNLRHGWSSVYCFEDGSEASRLLVQQGSVPVSIPELNNIEKLTGGCVNFLDKI